MKTLGVLRCAALALAVVVCGGALGQQAWAQTPAQKQASKEHFEQARRLYDVGRYPEAIEEYQKAYLNVEDPVFLFNIAQSYRLNDQPEEAIRFYKNYLRRAPDAVNRIEVEKRIAELQREVDLKSRPVTVTPPPPATEPAVVPPVATEPPPPVLDTVAPTAVPPPSEPGKWRTTGFILAGVGGSLLVTSVITGAMANKAAKDVEKGPVFDPDIEKRGRSLNGIAILTGLLGVVAGVAGGYLLLTSGGSSTSDVAASPRVALAPVVGADYTGAQASLRF